LSLRHYEPVRKLLDSDTLAAFDCGNAALNQFYNASPLLTKGMAQHPVPVIILARLAIDFPHQDKGLGTALLKEDLRAMVGGAV
jgi:hypothetical protein